MFKIPDFSLAPRLCKQAGLDLVSAWSDLDPLYLYRGLYAVADPGFESQGGGGGVEF